MGLALRLYSSAKVRAVSAILLVQLERVEEALILKLCFLSSYQTEWRLTDVLTKVTDGVLK